MSPSRRYAGRLPCHNGGPRLLLLRWSNRWIVVLPRASAVLRSFLFGRSWAYPPGSTRAFYVAVTSICLVRCNGVRRKEEFKRLIYNEPLAADHNGSKCAFVDQLPELGVSYANQ